MTEAEQESTFVRVAERILERHELSRSAPQAEAVQPEEDAQPPGENFIDLPVWMRLIKIGQWIMDDQRPQILGVAPHAYLLSRHEYGQHPFEVRASLQFSRFAEHIEHPINKMNAGIILGWNKDKDNPRYYNILISGVDVVIERIGFNGGSVVRDWEHVTDPVPLKIEEHKPYEFTIAASHERIEVRLGTEPLVSLDRPVGIQGRVGLRPWRSQLACTTFQVKEKPEQERASNK